MSKLIKFANTSNVIRFALKNSTTGQGVTGGAFNSTGLIISTIADNEVTPTVYAAAGSTIETITTLGTFAAPTATKCRFKEVDSTNHPGLYEFQFADARFSVASSKVLVVTVSGVTNLLTQDYEIELTRVDVQSAATFMTGVNGIAPPTNWNLDSIDASGRRDISKILGTAISTPATAGILDVNIKNIANAVVNTSLAQLGVNAVTVADKTGHGLSAAAIQAIWDALTANLTTAGSIGKKLADWVIGTTQTGDSYTIVNDASFGNAKLVRSTTPANTFDVSATGEGGLDFNNVKNATGATTLTNITIPLVTTATNLTTNNDKTGYALSASGITAIWAYVIEGAHTAVGYMRLFASALASVLSGAATTTVVIKDIDNTKTRITATVDSNGNRSAITLDET